MKSSYEAVILVSSRRTMSRGDIRQVLNNVFKPLPPVGAGGGYMFSGRPSMPLSVRASVRP